MSKTDMQGSRYFTYRELANGVYAAIANEDQGTFGNCGIIDIGNHTLILDISESIKSAHELRLTAEGIDQGLETEDIIRRTLPEPFDAWSIDGTPSEPNVRFYYNRLTIQEEYPL
ncbi:MAG: hypothetical protein U9R58_12255 [Chloroflexota bacterium]|nr:hypothetical protein [Chloroflexota bacterium]